MFKLLLFKITINKKYGLLDGKEGAWEFESD